MKNFSTVSSILTNLKTLRFSSLATPLGKMMAIADEKVLYLLEFQDCETLDKKMGRLAHNLSSQLIPGVTPPIHSIERELKLYFSSRLKEFKTPFHFFGTHFQTLVWQELQKIPFGTTRSYSQLSHAIGRLNSFRAAARANGSNRLAIIIPCHRVINANGTLGGYSGGISRKEWLVEHEKKSAQFYL